MIRGSAEEESAEVGRWGKDFHSMLRGGDGSLAAAPAPTRWGVIPFLILDFGVLRLVSQSLKPHMECSIINDF